MFLSEWDRIMNSTGKGNVFFGIHRVLKKNFTVTLVETVTQTLFRTILLGVGNTAIGFYIGGEREWAQL